MTSGRYVSDVQNYAAFQSCMDDATYASVDPISCIPFTCIRYTMISAVLWFVSTFKGRRAAKIGPAARRIVCKTDCANLVLLYNNQKEFIHAPLQERGYFTCGGTQTVENQKRVVWNWGLEISPRSHIATHGA